MTLQVAEEDKAEKAVGMTALIFRQRQGSLWLSKQPRRRGVAWLPEEAARTRPGA